MELYEELTLSDEEPGFRTPQTKKLSNSLTKTLVTPKSARKFKTPNKTTKDRIGSSSECNRGRTPSGQVLTSDYGDIRRWFQESLNNEQTQIKFGSVEQALFKKRKRSEINMTRSRSNSQGNTVDADHHNQVINTSEPNQGVNHDQEEHDKMCKQTISGNHTDEEEHDMQDAIAGNIKEAERCQIDETAEMDADTDNPADREGVTPLPQAMDTLAVMKMFAEMREEMKVAMSKINAMEAEKKTLEHQNIGQITDKQEQLKREVDSLKRRNMLLNGQICRLSQTMSEMREKMEKMEINSSKKMVVLSGFYASSKKYICLKQLDNFFEKQMRIDVFVDDVFQMGDFSPPNLVITFQSQEDKRLLFKHIGRIKKLRNKDNKPMYFKDFLPAEVNERKRRENDIIKKNEKKGPGEKIDDMKIKKGGLYVNKQLYQKRINPPDPSVMLKMSIKEIEDTLKYKVFKATKQVKNQKDTFIGYAVPANTESIVKKAYLHVKLHHPSVRHIICAYTLPGVPDFEYNDYQDDEEPGGGRALLELLQMNEIKDTALFVARYCKDEKLGPTRFNSMQEAAVCALNQIDFNEYAGKTQHIDYESESAVLRKNQLTQVKTDRKQIRGTAPNYRGGHRDSTRRGLEGRSTTETKRKTDSSETISFQPKDEESIEEELKNTTKRQKYEKNGAWGDKDGNSTSKNLSNSRGLGYKDDWPLPRHMGATDGREIATESW